MKYKVLQSKSKDGVVYRKFNYTPKQIMGVKGFLSIVFLSVGIFLLIPDFSDLIVYSAGSAALNRIFDISTQQAWLFFILIYKGIGLILLIAAIICGGQYIQAKLKRKMIQTKKRLRIK